MFADGIRQSTSTDEEEASACPDWWEKSALNPNAKERVGYPTQKPLALLHRIIAASTNPGRAAMNASCGCVTACMAAALAGECEWTGIDVSPKATELVRARMEGEVGVMHNGAVRTDILLRTDLARYRRTRAQRTGRSSTASRAGAARAAASTSSRST